MHLAIKCQHEYSLGNRRVIDGPEKLDVLVVLESCRIELGYTDGWDDKVKDRFYSRLRTTALFHWFLRTPRSEQRARMRRGDCQKLTPSIACCLARESPYLDLVEVGPQQGSRIWCG